MNRCGNPNRIRRGVTALFFLALVAPMGLAQPKRSMRLWRQIDIEAYCLSADGTILWEKTRQEVPHGQGI